MLSTMLTQRISGYIPAIDLFYHIIRYHLFVTYIEMSLKIGLSLNFRGRK